jgi:hypothetical protein
MAMKPVHVASPFRRRNGAAEKIDIGSIKQNGDQANLFRAAGPSMTVLFVNRAFWRPCRAITKGELAS